MEQKNLDFAEKKQRFDEFHFIYNSFGNNPNFKLDTKKLEEKTGFILSQYGVEKIEPKSN
jgi:hypothetical protein